MLKMHYKSVGLQVTFEHKYTAYIQMIKEE